MNPSVRLAAILLPLLCAAAAAGTLSAKKVKIVSTTTDGSLGTDGSFLSSLSKSGRYVAFLTRAPNLLPGVTPNGKDQVVRKDTKTGELRVVSVNAQGALADDTSHACVMSANGKKIAFTSIANNLAGASGGMSQVFWKDLVTGELRRVSESISNFPADAVCLNIDISDDGNRVAFDSAASNLPGATPAIFNCYLYDAKTDVLERFSYGALGVDPNQATTLAGISGNGRHAVFTTTASNMGFPQAAPAGTTNLYVRNLATDQTALVNFGANGQAANGFSYGPSLSKNGRFVAFVSQATNLVAGGTPAGARAYVLDRKKSKMKLLTVPATELVSFPFVTQLSNNGRRVLLWIIGANPPVFKDSFYWAAVVDRVNGDGRLFSLSSAGNIAGSDDVASPTLLRNGTRIAFTSSSQILNPGPLGPSQVYTAKCKKL